MSETIPIPEEVMQAARQIALSMNSLSQECLILDKPSDEAVEFGTHAIALALLARDERAAKIMNARLPLYPDIAQKNAIRECISSVRSASAIRDRTKP